MNTIPRKLGRYQIIRELGRGAMGVVFKAYDPVIEREVAIKAIQLAFQVSGEEKKIYLGRFFREAKAAGKLNHPNIVTIYDVDEDKETGTPFIVMEFLEGTTLQEIVASGVLLPLEDSCGIIMQMADALNYAHQQGVVHRDIKVGNILILKGMKAKIMDFGIARMTSSDLTQSGQFIGTPNYMSPEQVDGKKPVDGRSDLFSLGVISYLLLTGQRPFSGDSFTAVSYQIVHVDPVPPRVLNPGVPEVYNKILSKLLAKSTGSRYQTGAELISDLKKLEGTTFEAREDLEEITTEADDSMTSPTVMSSSTPATQTTVSELHDPNLRRLTGVAFLILVATALLFGGVYYFKSPPKTETRIITVPSGSTKEMSRQNLIRSKWDLAMNYYQNELYDPCIEQLNEILKIDPEYEEAVKFLKLVEQTKKEQAKSLSASHQSKQQQGISPATQPTSATANPPSSVQPVPAVPQKPTPKPPAGNEAHFELDHTLPSGTLTIYAGEAVIYAGTFTGTKHKFLMITRYKGQLSGSFKIPAGAEKLKLHLVCKELGISTLKEIETGPNTLPAKVLKISYTAKELEARWGG